MTNRLHYATYWALIPWVCSGGLTLWNHQPLRIQDGAFLVISYPVYVWVGCLIHDAMVHDGKKKEADAEAAAKAAATEEDDADDP